MISIVSLNATYDPIVSQFRWIAADKIVNSSEFFTELAILHETKSHSVIISTWQNCCIVRVSWIICELSVYGRSLGAERKAQLNLLKSLYLLKYLIIRMSTTSECNQNPWKSYFVSFCNICRVQQPVITAHTYTHITSHQPHHLCHLHRSTLDIYVSLSLINWIYDCSRRILMKSFSIFETIFRSERQVLLLKEEIHLFLTFMLFRVDSFLGNFIFDV